MITSILFQRRADSFEVLNVVDPTEYAALPEASKDAVRLIISCGTLDLAGTGKVMQYLNAIFANSPITKAAINSL
jgi:hypothetical protein